MIDVDAVMNWLEDTATLDEKIYAYSAGFVCCAFIGIDDQNSIVSLQEIPAETILFTVPVVTRISNAQRIDFIQAPPAGKRKVPIAIARERNVLFYSTFDGSNAYFWAHYCKQVIV